MSDAEAYFRMSMMACALFIWARYNWFFEDPKPIKSGFHGRAENKQGY